MDLSLVALLTAVGFMAGLFGSMLGFGGGIFVVPILSIFLGIEVHKAIGTSLIAVIATSGSAASVYMKARLTNIRLGMVLETVTTVGAVTGGFLAAALSGQALSALFAVMLVYTGYSMFTRRGREGEIQAGEVPDPPVGSGGGFVSALSEAYYDRALRRSVSYDVKALPAGLLASAAGGAISGLLGLGGGIVKVPVMNVFMGVPIKAATATSNFMVGITAATSAFIYYAHGHITPSLVAPTVIGVFFGAQAGSRLAQRIDGNVLRGIFVVVLGIMAVQMFLRAINVSLFS